MKRPLLLLVGLVVLAGCSAPGTSPFDPFSRTRVEPPRTGWILPQRSADPYYSNTGPPSASQSALVSGEGAARPAQSLRGPNVRESRQQQSPGIGLVEQSRASVAAVPGDRVRIPLAAREAPEWSESVAPGTQRKQVPAGPSERTRQTARTTRPHAQHTASSSGYRSSSLGATPSSSDEPRRLTPAQQAVDIMDLPPAGGATRTQSPARSSGIRLVSATEALADSASGSTRFARPSAAVKGGAAPDSFSAAARYGYDAEYRWLKGKLEHSQIDRRWKLRYIPIDGSTDPFGGSVVISNASVLDGYQRGEFVEIRGELGAQPQDDQGYAPEYEVRQVKRLGS